MLTRRGLLTGLGAACAAPAIVRAASLMPVRTTLWTPPPLRTEVALFDQLGRLLGYTFAEDVLDGGLAYIPVDQAGEITAVRLRRGDHEIWQMHHTATPVCESMTVRVGFQMC